MAGVDRDLDDVIRFCRQFGSEYLAPLRDNASRLRQIAQSTGASLGGTRFATRAAEKLEEAAEQLSRAAQEGEERIRVIEKRAQRDRDRNEELTERF